LFDFLISSFCNDENAITIINLARDCEGMLRGYGQHAAGVIIYDGDDITDYIPVKKGNLGFQTEMDMIQCEAIGLLKMDVRIVR
jgi:DNA polymerase III alpha subunit